MIGQFFRLDSPGLIQMDSWKTSGQFFIEVIIGGMSDQQNSSHAEGSLSFFAISCNSAQFVGN